MIEAVALVYVVVQAYGLESALSYGALGSFVAWVLFGQFTRGRNEDLEELTLRSPSPAAASATSGCLGDAGEGVDLAAMATPATPGVRRSVSGGTLEVFSEMREHASVNPWVNATWRVTAAERVKMALLAPWVLPARCAMIAAATVLAIVFANVATCGWDGTRPESLLQRVAERRRLRGLRATPEALPLRAGREVHDSGGGRVLPDTERMPRWRLFVGSPVLWCVRVVLCGLGFWRIDVRGEVDDAARVVVCNHLSMVEPLALLVATRGATPVTASDFAKLPALGPVGKLYQLLWLDRSDATSRAVVVDAILHRTKRAPAGAWPPVLVFPEGTTLNGRALISFKPGAFAPGAVVQPCVARFPFSVRCGLGLDPSWTTAGPQFGELSLRMLLQPWNRLRLDFLQPYAPSPAEVADPVLFSRNVRAVMASALDCPVTDHGWADMWLNMAARDLGLPPHKTLVQLTQLRRLLGGDGVERHAAAEALQRFASADAEKSGALNLDQFRAALRGGDAAAEHKAPDIATGAFDADALFNLLKRDRATIDFFSFLVGISLLEDSDRGALQLVFNLLDEENTGFVPRSKADLALAGDFHNNTVPDDERRDSFIAAATPASGEAQLDVDEFCAYVRANTARYTRSWSDDRGANVV